MDKVRDSYNVDALAQAVGEAALAEADYFDRERAAVRDRRATLTRGLEALGFDVVPSQANFVFARHARAGELYRGLYERDVFVRYWDKPGLADAIRVTVGTDDEHAALLEALRGLIG